MPPEGQPISETGVSRELHRGDVVMVAQKAMIQLGREGQDWVVTKEFKAAIIKIAESGREKSMFKNISGGDVPLYFNGETNKLEDDKLFSTKTRWIKKEK